MRLVYQDYLNDPRPENMPILEDLYNQMLLSEKLYPHLLEIDETAQSRLEPVSYTHLLLSAEKMGGRPFSQDTGGRTAPPLCGSNPEENLCRVPAGPFSL